MSDYNLSSMSDKELAELKTEIRKEEERRDETITLLDSLSYRYIHGYSYKKLFKTLAELTEIFKTNGCLLVKTYYDTLGVTSVGYDAELILRFFGWTNEKPFEAFVRPIVSDDGKPILVIDFSCRPVEESFPLT